MKRFFVALLALSLQWSVGPAFAQSEEACRLVLPADDKAAIKLADLARMDGYRDTAIRILRPLAEHGNSEAQYTLAGVYYWGKPRDMQQAFHWYLKAAEQGYVKAELA